MFFLSSSRRMSVNTGRLADPQKHFDAERPILSILEAFPSCPVLIRRKRLALARRSHHLGTRCQSCRPYHLTPPRTFVFANTTKCMTLLRPNGNQISRSLALLPLHFLAFLDRLRLASGLAFRRFA